MITGYAGITIRVPDVEAALRVYTEGLQMPLCMANTVKFPEGTTVSIVEGGKASANRSGWTHLCLDSCNADDGWTRATGLGAVPSREDKQPTGGGGLYGGFLRFPGGEEVELWHICKNGELCEPYQPGAFVKAFVHAAVTAPDKEDAIAFFEALGIRLKIDWGWGCSMQLKNKQELEVFPGGNAVTNDSGLVEVCFAVDDAAESYAIALKHGAIPVQEPQKGMASVIGPGGTRIRFAEGITVETVDLFHD